MVSDERTGVVLLVAAEAREFAGLLSRVRDARRTSWGVAFARTALLNGRPVALVANGAGATWAAQAVHIARAKLDISAVVSTGLCGALHPDFRVGDIFVATAIDAAGEIFPVRVPSCPLPHHRGRLVSIDRVAQTAEDKAALRARGDAVEMEAAGIAREMRQWKIPLYCVRGVSDGAHESFAFDLDAARRPDGRFSTSRMVTAALRRPFRGIPELVRLAKQSGTASRALGDFLADCRF